MTWLRCPAFALAMMRFALRPCRTQLTLAHAGRRFAAVATAAPPQFTHTDLFQTAAPKETPWRKLTGDGVAVMDVHGRRVLKVRAVTPAAFTRACSAELTGSRILWSG
jgi:hypothetical protein